MHTIKNDYFAKWLNDHNPTSQNYEFINGNTDKFYTPETSKFSKILSILLRITSVALVATFLLLACTWLPSNAGNIGRLHQKSPELQEKLDLLRQLSKEAGLPQVELNQEDICLDEGCLDAGKL